jgi:hypothetical protein
LGVDDSFSASSSTSSRDRPPASRGTHRRLSSIGHDEWDEEEQKDAARQQSSARVADEEHALSRTASGDMSLSSEASILSSRYVTRCVVCVCVCTTMAMGNILAAHIDGSRCLFFWSGLQCDLILATTRMTKAALEVKIIDGPILPKGVISTSEHLSCRHRGLVPMNETKKCRPRNNRAIVVVDGTNSPNRLLGIISTSRYSK